MGRHSTIFSPPNASVQWRPDCLTIHTKKWLLRAGFLGAPPISLVLPVGANSKKSPGGQGRRLKSLLDPGWREQCNPAPIPAQWQ